MKPKLKILVLGCGAIGGIYAAHLARVADVIGFDINREHVAAIGRDGLRITGRTAITARFPVYCNPTSLSKVAFDAVLVLVKSQRTAAAFQAIQPHLGAVRPLVVTMQNGLGNVEALAAFCDWDIAHGVSTEAGRYAGPGTIEHFIHGEDSWLGPARGPLESVERFGALLDAAGLPTRVVGDPRGAIWSKFIFNCVMNPVGAIMRGENRARYEVPELAQLIDAMFAECIGVAEAQGITPTPDPMHIVKKIRAGALPLTRHAGSMAADIAAGRETELEALTGYLIRTAHALGVPVPIAETVYRLAKGVEYAAALQARGMLADRVGNPTSPDGKEHA